MTARRFVDANVFLQYLLRDDVDKAESVRELLERVEAGSELVVTNHLVIFEVIFTLHHSHRLPKTVVRDAIQQILDLQGLRVPEGEIVRMALDWFVLFNVAFTDAFSAVWMRERGVTEVYTWDREFDRLPDVIRVEP